MSVCINCRRNMGILNIVYCSVECRNEETEKGSGITLDVNKMKTPPAEANRGLRRPYGNHEVIE